MVGIQRNLAIVGALCALFSCSKAPQTNESAPAGGPAVTIYTGGPIYTGLDDAPSAEAVAVADGAILAVGSRALVESSAGANPEIVDLKGAALYPGFTDAHAHLLGIGQRELELNLEGTRSVTALVDIIAQHVPQTEEGAVLFGRGWIETGWPEGRMPSRDDLDAVSAGRLVILTRADGHALVANSAAIDAAGVDATTPDPDGGKIERDANGRATGIFIDNAMALIYSLIAAPDEASKREAYAKASEVYAAYGWTGQHSMSADPDDIELTEALSDDGAIKIRVYNSIDKGGLDMLAATGPRHNKNNRVITRSVKLYMDGALGSRGAALLAPYSDRPDMSGLLLTNHDEAIGEFEKALAAGLQVNMHAIGDRGNRLLLDWYAEVFAAHPDKTDLRWRDEHTQIVHPDDIARFAELGVIPSMQPSHAIGDLYFVPARLGPDRIDGAYAWRALIDAGSIIAGGSDAPVERGDPRIEFYAAVARRGLDGYSDENWRPDQKVTRAEALKMFTIWPAYASFQEDSLGTIEPGKRADFTVFSKDIMTIPEADILTVEPVMTVVDGEIIFRAN